MKNGILDFFGKDHERLDDLFRQFQELKNSDVLKAEDVFREFKRGLQRHIVWEEEILFPVFEEKTGIMACGPTQVMRMEHQKIKQCLEDIYEKVQENSSQSNKEEGELLSVLSSHNFKEEHILYPALDEMLGHDEKDAVFTAIKNMGERRYRAFC
jgi:iron-sulfur cluster repair protein YtfE (RIC family)